MQSQESPFDQPVAGEKRAFEIFSVIERFGLEGLENLDENLAVITAEKPISGMPIDGDWEGGV